MIDEAIREASPEMQKFYYALELANHDWSLQWHFDDWDQLLRWRMAQAFSPFPYITDTRLDPFDLIAMRLRTLGQIFGYD